MGRQSELRETEAMAATNASRVGRSNIVDFYNNRSVLITGGSGFIGKVLIEKLLRTCHGIKHIFVLIRPKWNKQPDERLQELLRAPLFDGVRDDRLAERVIVVEGDVTQTNLGLSETNLLRIMNEVSVIYHSAATVKFDEPLKQSIGINISGTKNMIEVCRKIPQLAALVHVSTAYANCDKDQIDEHIYPMDINPEKLIELSNWLDQDTLQELKRKLLGARPNTYTYTKALAEWLLIKCARDLPVVICRPSIVVASWREPFSGWVDNVNGPTGIILGAGKGLIRSMPGNRSAVADLVPVDTVINMVITLAWFAHVYQNHKHLHDGSESVIDSSIDSVSAEELKEGTHFASQIYSKLSDQFNEAIQSYSHESESNCNNNNNSNHSYGTSKLEMAANFHSEGSKLKLKVKGDSEGCRSKSENSSSSRSSVITDERNLDLDDNDNSNNGLSHHYHIQHQKFTDDGYGSASQSPYAKSTDSASLSASSSSTNLTSSPTNRTNDCEDGDHNDEEQEEDRNNNNNNSISENRCTKGDFETTFAGQSREKEEAMLSLATQRRLAERKQAAFEYKLKQFRHNTQLKLAAKSLPEELADIPVFHCTSGGENPISWGRIQFLVMSIIALYPSISTYRYPSGSFTNNGRLDDFYRLTLHYIPAYIADFLTRLMGGKPILVKLYRKFDQASSVLRAFTSRQWQFNAENRTMLIEEIMSEEDKRLFNCDVRALDWSHFIRDYTLGVRQFILKEPMGNLKQARANLSFVYYRNLALQLLFFALPVYCLVPTSWLSPVFKLC